MKESGDSKQVYATEWLFSAESLLTNCFLILIWRFKKSDLLMVWEIKLLGPVEIFSTNIWLQVATFPTPLDGAVKYRKLALVILRISQCQRTKLGKSFKASIYNVLWKCSQNNYSYSLIKT